jgi:hypothetical protein
VSSSSNIIHANAQTVEHLLAALICTNPRCACHTAVRRGRGLTHCPAHQDDRPSLSAEERDGRLLLHCHGGCSQDSVLAALRSRGLWPARDAASSSAPAATRGRIVATYPYRDECGAPLFEVVRRGPKGFAQRRPGGNGEWVWSLDGTRRVLYRLPELLAAVSSLSVFISEGEKDADRLASLGLVATTNPGGAGKWRPEYDTHLRGRHVVILPDADEPGRRHADQVARSLVGVAASVKIVALPGLPERGDVSDWLDAGHTREELLALVEQAPEWTPRDAASMNGFSALAEHDASPATRLVALARASGADLFHDPSGRAWVTFPVAVHRETWPLDASAIKQWAAGLLYTTEGRVPSESAISDALRLLTYLARTEGPEHGVPLRVARDAAGAVWLDLLDARWRAVKITAKGWSVHETLPADVRFHRAPGMFALPEPERGGDVALLRPFLNLAEGRDWLVLAAWLVQAMLPQGPYPVLLLLGEQGSAKSTAARLLASLVDPHVAPLLTFPADERDLLVATASRRVLIYDNISRLRDHEADALCRLATGGGLLVRRLFTDGEPFIITAQTPVVLTSINTPTSRGDFLDRVLCVTLAPIPDERRRTEADLLRDFEVVRPRMLGGLLDVVTATLRNLPAVRLPALPRLADFAAVAIAAAPALGVAPNEMLATLGAMREEAVAVTLDGSPVAEVVFSVLDEASDGTWSGTARDLLDRAPEELRRSRGFPDRPESVARALRRLAPALRVCGVEMAFARNTHRGVRTITLSRRTERPTVGNEGSSIHEPTPEGVAPPADPLFVPPTRTPIREADLPAITLRLAGLPDDGRRKYTLDLARALDWPRIPFGRGRAVAAGADAWAAFAVRAAEEDVNLVLAALQAIDGPEVAR